jgi:hypothetical protein
MPHSCMNELFDLAEEYDDSYLENRREIRASRIPFWYDWRSAHAWCARSVESTRSLLSSSVSWILVFAFFPVKRRHETIT